MPEWRTAVSPQCPLDKQVAICQLVSAYLSHHLFPPQNLYMFMNELTLTADIFADLLLIIAPLRLIWGMSAEDGTRRRLMIIFSTSIVTT